MDYNTFGEPAPRVFIGTAHRHRRLLCRGEFHRAFCAVSGMNEYPNSKNFDEISGALQKLPEFGEFFSMFTVRPSTSSNWCCFSLRLRT